MGADVCGWSPTSLLPSRCLPTERNKGSPGGAWEAMQSTCLVLPKKETEARAGRGGGGEACPARPGQTETRAQLLALPLLFWKEAAQRTDAASLNSGPSLKADAGGNGPLSAGSSPWSRTPFAPILESWPALKSAPSARCLVSFYPFGPFFAKHTSPLHSFIYLRSRGVQQHLVSTYYGLLIMLGGFHPLSYVILAVLTWGGNHPSSSPHVPAKGSEAQRG